MGRPLVFHLLETGCNVCSKKSSIHHWCNFPRTLFTCLLIMFCFTRILLSCAPLGSSQNEESFDARTNVPPISWTSDKVKNRTVDLAQCLIRSTWTPKQKCGSFRDLSNQFLKYLSQWSFWDFFLLFFKYFRFDRFFRSFHLKRIVRSKPPETFPPAISISVDYNIPGNFHSEE